jgi:integrase
MANPRYRLNYAEMEAMLDAVETVLEWRCIGLGLLGGFRSTELRGLQGRHFRRDGLVEVTAEMGKGGKARWVAVVPGLSAVVAEIRENVGTDEYVLPAQRWANPPLNSLRESLRLRPMSQQALGSLVERVAKRANVPGRITAHCLRHANAQVMAEYAGIYIASAQLGHGDLRTTQGYLGTPTTDRQMEGARKVNLRTSVRFIPLIPSKATTGIEPV